MFNFRRQLKPETSVSTGEKLQTIIFTADAQFPLIKFEVLLIEMSLTSYLNSLLIIFIYL